MVSLNGVYAKYGISLYSSCKLHIRNEQYRVRGGVGAKEGGIGADRGA